ncbi:hypothetical protein [Actinomadura sp. 6K520]|uniref:hypothetical protein n=1 Tax=Actinomadura sp. 6K520 TaxID=2530364 RepID=UPI0010494E46|nr:hypothetical protein [Actinomadura sp. 6K520]TDE35460.1 hypothetical protein E1289_07660 [Actinomadura sp. 6K520]
METKYPFIQWQELDFAEQIPEVSAFNGDYKQFLDGSALQLVVLLRSLSADEELVDRVFLQTLVILKSEWPKFRNHKNVKLRMYYVGLRIMRRTQSHLRSQSYKASQLQDAGLYRLNRAILNDEALWLQSWEPLFTEIRAMPRRIAEITVLSFFLGVSKDDTARIIGVTPLQITEYYRSIPARIRAIKPIS